MLKFFRPHFILKYFTSYIIVFAGATAYTSLAYKIDPIARSTPGYVLLFILALIGSLIICERGFLSRFTSALTLIVLGLVAIKFEDTPVPSSAMLILALCLAWVGSQSLWHQQVKTSQTLLRAFSFALGTIIISILFVYTVTVLTRIADYQVHCF